MAPQMTFVCIQGFQLICNVLEKICHRRLFWLTHPFFVTSQFIIINNLLSAQYITTKK